MRIDELNLEPVAQRGAELLLAAHPWITFTSGRRSPVDQARAMAQNVAKNRMWIIQTYRPSQLIGRMQLAIERSPGVITVPDIANLLLDAMLGVPAAELMALSRHLTGMAFDVQPVHGRRGMAVKQTIATLPGLDKFLDHEGGLERWHVQFKAAA